MRGPGLVAAMLLVASARPAGAVELDRGDLRLELSGQLRSLYTLGREIEAEPLILEGSTRRHDSWMLMTRARAELEAVWRERVYAELVYDHEVRTGTGLDSLYFVLGDRIGTRTWLDADRVISRHADLHWRHGLYRAWVRWELDSFELTLGRQRIALGRGRLWNPTDLFNPIFPLAIEGDQRVGQDAGLLRLRLSDDLRAVAIWAPQDDPDAHRAALRLELDHTALDGALMLGRFRRDWVFGGDFATNWGDAALRAEVTYSHLNNAALRQEAQLTGRGKRDRRIWQVVASLDYTFSVGSGLYTLVEHLFNQNTVSPTLLAEVSAVPPSLFEAAVGALAAIQEPFLDRITTVSEDQTGLQLSYEFSPFWQGSMLLLYDWHGPSAALVPSLVFSPRSALSLTAAAQLFWGRDSSSEYGRRPALLILQAELFF